MTQKHGRRYEHTLVNGLDEVTPKEVYVAAEGYSGNSNSGECDIVITVDPKFATRHDTTQFNIEAKKRQGDDGNRVSNVMTGSETDETGLEELQRLVDGTPMWGDPILAIKFDHRKLVVLDGRWVLSMVDEHGHYVPQSVQDGILSVLEPRLTPSENISMIKPPLSSWSSSSAADDDCVVISRKLGLPFGEGVNDG